MKQLFFSALGLAVGLSSCAVAAPVAGVPIFGTTSLAAWEFVAQGGGAIKREPIQQGLSKVSSGRASVYYGPAIAMTVGKEWATWCCSYYGQVVWTGAGNDRRKLLLSGVAALGFFVEPRSLHKSKFRVTLSTGQEYYFSASGKSGAAFFGFVGYQINSISIENLSGDSFAIGDLRLVERAIALPPDPNVIANYAYLTSNQFSTTVNYPCKSCKTELAESLAGSEDPVTYTELANNGETFGGNGATYVVPLTRTKIPSVAPVSGSSWSPAQYDLFNSNWLVQPPTDEGNYEIPEPWIVYDKTRNSVYNTPYENLCTDNSPEAVYIFQGKSCKTLGQPMAGTLDALFATQVAINGTGMSINYGYVKTFAATFLPNCGLGSQYDSSNSFLEVPDVRGSCNTVITQSSVAVFPNPKRGSGTRPACGDNIVAVSVDPNNRYTKTVGDLCPDCVGDTHGAHFHIDNWVSSKACKAHDFNDLGTFWDANTRSSTQ